MPERPPPNTFVRVAAALRARTWKSWYGLRWRLYDQRRAQNPRLRRIVGLDLLVLPGVLDPALFGSGVLLADAIARIVVDSDHVLDLGTGCGIGALAAARAGCTRVVATDADPTAVRCAIANVSLADASERVSVRLGDLFDPVGLERFDLVTFNPPWLDGVDAGRLAQALVPASGAAQRFAADLGDHLAPGGRALLVLPDGPPAERWLGPLRSRGFVLARSLERDLGSERLCAWVASPAPGDA